MSTTGYPTLITPLVVEKLDRLRALIDDAYDLYLNHDSDGSHKSSEGRITLNFGTTFTRQDGEVTPTVEVYSYVFGPSRSHWFESLDDALEAVTKWVQDYHDYLLCDTCGNPQKIDDWAETKHCPFCDSRSSKRRSTEGTAS